MTGSANRVTGRNQGKVRKQNTFREYWHTFKNTFHYKNEKKNPNDKK